MTRRSFAMLLCAAALLPFAADAHEFKAGNLQIDHPWTRATPKAAEVAAGFMTITNHGDQPDRLIAASSPISDVGQIHTMVIENDVMKMQELAGGLEIPAGATVELKPKSFHVMFIGLRQELKEGETIEGELVFEKAGKVPVEYTVEAVGAQGDMGM
jgi:copper(I)-binding protein